MLRALNAAGAPPAWKGLACFTNGQVGILGVAGGKNPDNLAPARGIMTLKRWAGDVAPLAGNVMLSGSRGSGCHVAHAASSKGTGPVFSNGAAVNRRDSRGEGILLQPVFLHYSASVLLQ